MDDRGMDYMVINSDVALRDYRWLSSQFGKQQTTQISLPDGKLLDMRNVSAVWNRRWGAPILPPSFSHEEAMFSWGELNSLYQNLYLSSSCQWANEPPVEAQYNNKIFQLSVANNLNFRTPKTVVTNDPQKALDFYNSLKGKVIFKPVGGTTPPIYRHSPNSLRAAGVPSQEADEYPVFNAALTYTRMLTPTEIEKLSNVKWAPVCFQEHIEKIYDIRVSVIKDRIFACQIDSQNNQSTSTDFRLFRSIEDTPHCEIQLPSNVTKFVSEYMKRSRLSCGFFDFAIDRVSNDYVFLECNPNGQWLWIEDATGMKITASMVDVLAEM